jgi:SAM-dependent methyltransferase
MNETDHQQAALWNGPAGHAWVDAQALLDRLFAPFADRLADAVLDGRPGTVLDVGCGTGGTTLAIARRIGEAGRCVGIDISEPMIAAARSRAAREGTAADFVRADAQRHAFEPASVATIVSRFGVMFFDEPVAAFANLRQAATDDARLRVVAWRSAADNPFMTAAERAAAPLLPGLPPRRADGPGQFAFADRGHVATVLDAAGWRGIDIQPIDVTCTMPEAALLPYATRLGPVGLFLQQADEPTRARVIEAMRAAFEPYVRDGEVRFTAACWMIAATSGRRG